MHKTILTKELVYQRKNKNKIVQLLIKHKIKYLIVIKTNISSV